MQTIKRLLIGLSLMILSLTSPSSYAQETENSGIEEIIVTARQQNESLQDVPLSVSALRESALDEKGISVFEDYLLQLPSVTAGGSGPGTSTNT